MSYHLSNLIFVELSKVHYHSKRNHVTQIWGQNRIDMKQKLVQQFPRVKQGPEKDRWTNNFLEQIG